MIILFLKKIERQKFHDQKKNLYLLNASQSEDDGSEDRKDQEDEEDLHKNRFIFQNESLTETNKKLLIGTKNLAKCLHYRFPGYTVNRQVRVKKSEISEYNVISDIEDLNKIT